MQTNVENLGPSPGLVMAVIMAEILEISAELLSEISEMRSQRPSEMLSQMSILSVKSQHNCHKCQPSFSQR